MDFPNLLSLSLQQALGPTAIIYCLAAIGLNVHFGYTGLLNFGQAGVHDGRRLLAACRSSTIWGLSLWLGLPLAVVLTILLALLLGVPTLRLRADYLAIVTIAAAEIIRQTISAASFSETFGGQDGVTGFIGGLPRPEPLLGTDQDRRDREWSAYDFWVMTVGWMIVAVCCVIVWLLMRSPWGRVLKSIREDEDAVRSLGKNVYAYKMQSLIIGGMFGALAGHHDRAAIGVDRSVVLRHRRDLLRLHRAADRRRGPRARTGAWAPIIFWFLISALGIFFSQATGGTDPLIPDSIMTHDPGQPDALHLPRTRADVVDDLPTTRNLRRPKGAGDRCPLTRP